MGIEGQPQNERAKQNTMDDKLPKPSASYRRRAWVEFQRALDPLAPVKPLPPPHRH
jgi:hypothetical protein